MATTKAPLFGLDASGTLGGSIVFSKWRGRTYVRKHAVPANPRSALQIGMRAVFKYITQAFGALSDNEKAEWDDLAAPDNITQLNAQVKDAQTRARLNQGWRIGPDEAAGVTPEAPRTPTSVLGNKSAVLSWLHPLANQGDYTAAIYMRAAGVPTATIQYLRAVIDVGDLTVTITGLTNGIAYTWQVLETNIDGELGVLSNADTFTPAA